MSSNMTGNMTHGIEFRQVSKRYGGKQAQLVVQGIDLVVPQGTLTTLLGPSGCGKTTTLRLIAGLEPPSSGRVLIDGVDVTTLGAAERNVSMVFQSYALFPHLTVLGNVAYGLEVQGIGRDETRQRARATMDLVGLAGYDERLPSERLRVFRSCPLITPKDARSSLQMLAIARAMAALCAWTGRLSCALLGRARKTLSL